MVVHDSYDVKAESRIVDAPGGAWPDPSPLPHVEVTREPPGTTSRGLVVVPDARKRHLAGLLSFLTLGNGIARATCRS